MYKIFIIFLCIHTLLLGSFFEEEDPTHYYHVNVITGHLNLNFHDLEIKSPIPFSITRSYSSAGALERSSEDVDLLLNVMRSSEWMFQGGWQFLPHLNLLVQSDTNFKRHKAYLAEVGSNNVIAYSYYKEKKGYSYLKPNLKDNKAAGNLSSRKKIKHNVLKIKEKEAILSLPNGGKRYYSGNIYNGESFWRLDLEVLPSKHRILYTYLNEFAKPGKLIKIQLQNPDGTKTFAWIDFDHSSYEGEKVLRIKTSDGKCLTYQLGLEFKERNYLQNVETGIRPKETIHYQAGRKGTGARIESFSLGGKQQFQVGYYLPSNKEKEQKWAKKTKKHLKCDKVKSLRFPDPHTGQLIDFAHFSYYPKYTEVIDYDGILTRYFHDEERLLSIEHYDKTGNLHSKVEFTWKNDNLSSKRLLDNNGHLLFSKTFIYDRKGNIVREKWEDHSTHSPSISRDFTYSKSRLVLSEHEIDGLIHQYEYLDGTDLLQRKLTCYQGKILSREFFLYNSDNLLIGNIIDDGAGLSLDDLTNITERKVKRFDLDPMTGLCKTMAESYFDLNTLCEKPFLKHHYIYSKQKEIIEETIVYGPDEEKYTIYTNYDSAGHVIKKTTPLGKENIFFYDDFGNLLESKEVGSTKKIFEYDFLNRPKKCITAGKTVQSFYDIKGRLYAQTDVNQNTIYQTFDCFGRCTETSLPKVLNKDSASYTPKITSSYDLLGNLVSYTNPKGETTSTKYNILRKPISIDYPDGSFLSHHYNRDGNITKTIYPDQTEILYTYDPFQRMTSKIIRSTNGEILSEENWIYNIFHLLSYTNSMGLTTYYQYDGLGRKIEEKAEERNVLYTYDALGYLERITQGGYAKVQKHNIEGEIIQQWEEDSSHKIENHMFFFYGIEGRKEKAIRITSQGEAQDHFYYDDEGHLSKHIDPLGAKREFFYVKVNNALEQTVDQKTTLDPLGNVLIETYDANGRIVLLEKKDPHHEGVSSEQFFYDEAGNKAKRLVTIFEQNTPSRKYTTLWEHNKRGWLTKEIEEEKKCTTFIYDNRGRLIEKNLPSGVKLQQSYDGIDRLLELKSSDETIHYKYTYGKGALPIQAEDIIYPCTWKRTYNLFGEMVSETPPNGMTLHWSYDNKGRCTKFTLPDQSFLRYDYNDSHLISIDRYSSDEHVQYTHQYTKFDENGHVAEEKLINNLGSITTAHDLLERTKSQHTPWNSATLEYGPSGLVMKMENSLFYSKEYQYDPLNQLVKEGSKKYLFDSLGNPLDSKVNNLNQIIATDNDRLSYNENGNPINQSGYQDITYTYDALNRLNSIHYADTRHIQYVYDPFSRLYSKAIYVNKNSFFSFYESWSREVSYFLYDQEKEIGKLDDKNRIQELKVLGLGILGDIGAAVALELNSQVFAPLHDFNGNIIALVSPKGRLSEKIDIDAFGKAILNTSSINPWRFQSKRTEEHLIFFGNRFYDPNLGRWLTPDPAGSIESPNLYLYVLNCPLNRLDLFGLYSEDFRTEIPTSYFENKSSCVRCKVYFGEIQADWLIYSKQFQKLQFTDEEKKQSVDILHHFHELFSKDGMGIGLATFQNGIKNTYQEFEQSANATSKMFLKDGDGIFIAMYLPTRGVFKDVLGTSNETRRKETSEVAVTRQAMNALVETLAKVSPDLYWLHINHSRAGATGCAAIDGMNDEEKKLVHAKMIWLGVAPAEPLKKEWAHDSINIYSKKDATTGRFGKVDDMLQAHLPEEEKIYNIKFIDSASQWNESSFYFNDHSIMGRTYQNSLYEHTQSVKKDYGFYKETR